VIGDATSEYTVAGEAEAGNPEVSNTTVGYAGDIEPRYATIGAAGRIYG
ncbi:hypothetical protein A2U01_0109557, partial [Trifolium medium]|nr:hypothetical protein [Trifolium medium]